MQVYLGEGLSGQMWHFQSFPKTLRAAGSRTGEHCGPGDMHGLLIYPPQQLPWPECDTLLWNWRSEGTKKASLYVLVLPPVLWRALAWESTTAGLEPWRRQRHKFSSAFLRKHCAETHHQALTCLSAEHRALVAGGWGALRRRAQRMHTPAQRCTVLTSSIPVVALPVPMAGARCRNQRLRGGTRAPAAVLSTPAATKAQAAS